MYKTEKYNWTDFEEIKLESDKLLFEFTYDKPGYRYYCAETAKFADTASELKAPIAFCMSEDSLNGPIKLSDAINDVASFLPEGSVITGWEIKPCDSNGYKIKDENDFAKWMIANSERVRANKSQENVIAFKDYN